MERPPEFQTPDLLPESLLKQWLRRCGRGVKVYRGARIIGPGQVDIGDYSQVDEGVFIFGGQGTTLGRHVHLAFASSISGGGTCEIGDFAGIGAGARIITGTDLPEQGLTNPTIPADLRAVRRDRTTVGRHAVIFTNCVVFPGVTVGEGAIVSAGSVVHKDLNPWTVYAGHPLVQIGVRPRELVERQEKELAARRQSSPS